MKAKKKITATYTLELSEDEGAILATLLDSVVWCNAPKASARDLICEIVCSLPEAITQEQAFGQRLILNS